MIKTVTIIGANGTMGCNVSGIFASFGNAKVYMMCRSMEIAKLTIDKAAKSIRAQAIKSNLIPADYSMLKTCILESDLIFESVTEDFNIKFDINKEIAEYANDEQIICTGSSGLSIKKLAEAFPDKIRKNYLGLHFYNPPYHMTLCELVPSIYTDMKLLDKVKAYVTKKLYRTAVVVKDSPAFLGNRIGFQFINEALQYSVKYAGHGGIDYIDAILGQFSGRSMSPLVTSDFVGLDVHKAIVDNIYQNTNDYARASFIMPEYAISLINSGKMGVKSQGGLYKFEKAENGLKQSLVYDIASQTYREKVRYHFPFATEMIICLNVGDYDKAFSTLINNHSLEAELALEFLLKYVIYAINTANLIGDGIRAADDVMATGYNWCPPLAMIQALFGVDCFINLSKERISSDILSKVDLKDLLKGAETSSYDYRRYFRAKQ